MLLHPRVAQPWSWFLSPPPLTTRGEGAPFSHEKICVLRVIPLFPLCLHGYRMHCGGMIKIWQKSCGTTDSPIYPTTSTPELHYHDPWFWAQQLGRCTPHWCVWVDISPPIVTHAYSRYGWGMGQIWQHSCTAASKTTHVTSSQTWWFNSWGSTLLFCNDGSNETNNQQYTTSHLLHIYLTQNPILQELKHIIRSSFLSCYFYLRGDVGPK